VKAYWEDVVKVATVDAASGVNKYLGKTRDAATSVRIRLDQ
jgi:hypothetical protein